MILRKFLLGFAVSFHLVLNGNGRPQESKEEFQTNKAQEPTLTKAEWRQIHKFEDALKDEEGKLFYTDSWAVRLPDEAELEVADKIAEKHGFINLGKVCNQYSEHLSSTIKSTPKYKFNTKIHR